MKISILGLGYLGLPLAEALKSQGHEVQGSSRSEKDLSVKCFMLTPPALPAPALLQCDVLILNIPPFEGQPDWFKRWDLSGVKKIIFVSSTSILKAHPILAEEEAWVKTCSRWLIIRPGGLLGRGRHPGKHLSGRKDLKGQNHPVNLIHVEDVIGFLLKAIEAGITGESIDLVSDEHHSRKEFYSEFCQRSGLPLPEFDPEDGSLGPVVSNEAMKRYYQLKFPTMLGRSL